MTPIKFEGANENYGQPDDWDEEKQGKCETLPVFQTESGDCISVWALSDAEKQLIQDGQNITVIVTGGQVPINLSVQPIGGKIKPRTNKYPRKSVFTILKEMVDFLEDDSENSTSQESLKNMDETIYQAKLLLKNNGRI